MWHGLSLQTQRVVLAGLHKLYVGLEGKVGVRARSQLEEMSKTIAWGRSFEDLVSVWQVFRRSQRDSNIPALKFSGMANEIDYGRLMGGDSVEFLDQQQLTLHQQQIILQKQQTGLQKQQDGLQEYLQQQQEYCQQQQEYLQEQQEYLQQQQASLQQQQASLALRRELLIQRANMFYQENVSAMAAIGSLPVPIPMAIMQVPLTACNSSTL